MRRPLCAQPHPRLRVSMLIFVQLRSMRTKSARANLLWKHWAEFRDINIIRQRGACEAAYIDCIRAQLAEGGLTHSGRQTTRMRDCADSTFIGGIMAKRER